jgi:Arc/MetJ-type ribon-helix-helix transcriptional regulator
MRRARVTITVERQVLAEIDRLVRGGEYPNRSQAIEPAIRERIERLHRSRLARECAKLDSKEEQALANEQYAAEVDWPEYGFT